MVKARKKDTVASLASRYRISPASIADWNKVSASSAFKVGQQIVLFLPVRARASVQSKGNDRQKASSQQVRRKVSKATRATKR